MKRSVVLCGVMLAAVAGAIFVWLAAQNGRPLSQIVLAGFIGAFSGVVFVGLCSLFAWFIGRVREGPPARPDMLLGEEPLAEVRANHFAGEEARGGRLLLTSKRVIFQPHRFNSNRAPVVLELGGIDEVRALPPEQLALVVSGRVHHLVVATPRDGELEALTSQLESRVRAAKGTP